MGLRAVLLAALVVSSAGAAPRVDGNRLTYIDGNNPYYVGREFPKLTTPQWVGEDGVEAVVILAVDDMTDNIPKYEAFLRPILDRLKAIDGRAAVSIMTNQVDPRAPELQAWLKEGVAIDVHTLTHPCPLLQKGDFAEARRTFHGGVDLLGRIPGNRPVAFRMPCCDSLNTPSPRYFAELFNAVSPEGHFLTIDSSVFQITTPDDPALPRELVSDGDGRERFRKYLPFPSFVNTIENYPYPYVIGRLCWEFPCIVPSDWEAQNLQKPKNPRTVADMKAALDAVVLKQGVFDLVFHPHGWIENTQVVELIDHAVKAHGKKVKFLNFREAQERLDKHLLGGQPLRAANGQDNGVRILDLNNDGYLDVVVGNEQRRETRLWDPKSDRWTTGPLPIPLVRSVHFGVVRPDGFASMIVADKETRSGWDFDGSTWVERRGLIPRSAIDDENVGIRLIDLDHDGRSELIGSSTSRGDTSTIFGWSEPEDRWIRLPFGLPDRADAKAETGLRFFDLDEDGDEDILVSNPAWYGVYLFDSMEKGWTRVSSGKVGEPGAFPPFVRSDAGSTTDNGAWFHSRSIWWQNEDTAKLPDLVDRRSFNDLLKDVEPRAKGPEASRRSIRVRPGFRVDIAAQEPLVEDPIAFDWGADGRLWVLEMGDYPLGVDGKGKHGGVVRILVDKDGDGRYDTSTVFLDGLGFPTGLLPWRKGVLIACAPDILYAEDRDGDGKADLREVLFTGFNPGNQQHRLNGFDYGLDGWIYGANGDSGGKIRSLKTGAVVDIQGRDFRFRPDEGRFEVESGGTQFGRHRDDWGHWFGNNNSVWAWHYVLADRDLRRNPRAGVADARQILEPDRRLFPVSRTLGRFNDHDNANRVTSANSTTPYRDDLFGPAFEHTLFVSEPVHNLVHRLVLEPAGPTFRGSRPADESDREFLASSDNWFRPTMLKTGPDGALWVADMYRAVIEHPEWIPDDWEARLDLRAGHDQGRIYRVYPVDRRPRSIPRLDQLDTAGLVAALDSSSGWQRDMAQRLLLEQGDRGAADPLRQLALGSDRPKTRAQALWTLKGLGALDQEIAAAALRDPHAEVRCQALRVGRELARLQPTVGEAMARMVDDPDPQVRFELTLALGDWDDPRAGKALAMLVRADKGDPWQRAAILSSAGPHAAGILLALFAQATQEPPPQALVQSLFAMLAAPAGSKDLLSLLTTVSTPAADGSYADWQLGAVVGLFEAAERSGNRPGALERDDVLRRVDAVVKAARGFVEDEKTLEERRAMAVRVLGFARQDPGATLETLGRLLRPQVSPRLQQAAVSAAARLRDERVPATLLAGWRGQTPVLRGEILDTLLNRDTWVPAVLSALEGDRIPPAEIDVARRRRLLEHRDASIRQRAEKLFSQASRGRLEVIAAYRAALAQPGDPKVGEAVFRRVCAVCHRLGGEGVEVGPDLASLTDKSTEALLVAILDPNRAFEAKYTNFTIQMTDGRALSGMIAAETGNSVTLRRQEGKEEVLLRADIDAMAGTGQSLMPEGVEKDLKPRDLADLIAYLTASGPPRKLVEGNRPELVRPNAEDDLLLRADQAEIYGDSLTFESRYGNLGHWSAPNDRAAWTFQVDRPGRYAVTLDWACDDGTAGNAFVLEVEQSRIEGRVAGTGRWDDYQKAKVGEVDLAAGRHRLEFRPVGRIKGALIDLRRVELRPSNPDAKASGPCCGAGQD